MNPKHRSRSSLIVLAILSHLAFSSSGFAVCTPIAKRNMEAKYLRMKNVLGQPVGTYQDLRSRDGCAHEYQGGIVIHQDSQAFAINGAIFFKWKALGGLGSFLGVPLTDELATPDSVGRYNHFTHGSIYWRPCIGAFEVHGLIRNVWAAHGWENGLLGYPKSDETTTSDQVGKYSTFQGGAVYYHPSFGTFAMLGEFYRTWQDMGALTKLGYPTSAMSCSPANMCVQHFQHGTLDSNGVQFTQGRDLRGEIARRQIEIRHQGARPTCSVFAANFLLEYAYTEMCGNYLNHLSEEYLNHAANLATGRTDDGDFFSFILDGYNKFGIVLNAHHPYQSTYDFSSHVFPASLIAEGQGFLQSKLKLSGKFLKAGGTPVGLSSSEFNAIINSLNRGIPVALGRSHSMVVVGYKYDTSYEGGGYFIFRNSYGVATGGNGYQLESFKSVKATANDAIVYERTNN